MSLSELMSADISRRIRSNNVEENTSVAAEKAHSYGLIDAETLKNMTDGRVTKGDLRAAKQVVYMLERQGVKKNSEVTDVAHGLVKAVTQQLNTQSILETIVENFKDGLKR